MAQPFGCWPHCQLTFHFKSLKQLDIRQQLPPIPINTSLHTRKVLIKSKKYGFTLPSVFLKIIA